MRRAVVDVAFCAGVVVAAAFGLSAADFLAVVAVFVAALGFAVVVDLVVETVGFVVASGCQTGSSEMASSGVLRTP